MVGTVAERVIRVVRDEMLPPRSEKEVTAGARLVDDLGADSLDIVELVMEIEREFSIDIADEDVDGFKTVGDVIAYVERVVT